ncbi:uncharacterized protein PG986_005122 [Apiospora aurea]|uniref:BTB domain-containing protein n=1 Tax=Apiospora aurea TaxID=335848 RepID=A0ABR1QGX8_9PEZI
MPPPYDSILRSRPITFVVGPTKTEFVVHADAITRLSKPLRALVDGDMKEAKESHVVWDDVDDQTFARFIQWAYTDEYATAEPEILLDASNIQTGESSTASTKAPREPEKSLYSLQDKSAITLQPLLGSKGVEMAKAFTAGTSWAMIGATFEPRLNSEGCEDYSKVSSCHANLYIMADKYDIAPLGKLSMHKLGTTLKTFKLYPSRMSDILSLAELVFENTRDGDEMRLMIAHYCACIVEDLAKCEKFQPTLQAYPEFSSALMAKMTERLD